MGIDCVSHLCGMAHANEARHKRVGVVAETTSPVTSRSRLCKLEVTLRRALLQSNRSSLSFVALVGAGAGLNDGTALVIEG